MGKKRKRKAHVDKTAREKHVKKPKANPNCAKSLRILQLNAVSLKARSLLLERVLHQNKK